MTVGQFRPIQNEPEGSAASCASPTSSMVHSRSDTPSRCRSAFERRSLPFNVIVQPRQDDVCLDLFFKNCAAEQNFCDVSKGLKRKAAIQRGPEEYSAQCVRITTRYDFVGEVIAKIVHIYSRTYPDVARRLQAIIQSQLPVSS